MSEPLDEFFEARAKRAADWNVLANQVVGAESLPIKRQACAQKDAEIERLKALSHAWQDQLAAKDQRIAELEAAYDESMAISFAYHGRLAAMSAILERMPHFKINWTEDPHDAYPCREDCPACQWEAMKAKPK